ncbi:MAG: flagellar biosynthetic protein FliR [Myxococcota bacterium]|nr:flagellar biosynthetic protein FliR [Myxococcota bacterium]
MASVLGEVAQALARSGIDAGALGLAWARVTPAVILVPAFGLRALPAAARAVLGVALAATVFPALPPVPISGGRPWLLLAAIELGRGLPVAVAAAVPLWAATMAGGLADAFRGSQDAPSVPTVEGRATPLGVPFSLLASAIFLATGGPARVVLALALRPLPQHPVLAAVDHLVGGIALAVALGGPLLAAAVVVEVAAALIARAASPAQIHALLAPVRAIATLAVLAVVLERLATALSTALQAAP